MAQHESLNNGDELIIHSPATGYMSAWSCEDKDEFSGMAYLEVHVNSTALPGVTAMTINTNTFDVWKADNIEALKLVAKEVLKKDLVR